MFDAKCDPIALPDFAVCAVWRTDDGFVRQSLRLNEILQQSKNGLVLYFYPKDNTPGCTTQAQEISDAIDDYLAKGYTVFGVSRDGLKAHENFIAKRNLRFGLIGDGDEKLCRHFGVLKEKKLYGKSFVGVERSTFVFNKQGKLILQWRGVKAKEHNAALLALL